ncbi:MAG: hypothetical protein JSW20_13190 [Nitrospiraceae bacterium]|nr:MAG: hypothetical protein JSW20_13190 [Nitrospiraceae bacterium]
MRFPFRLLIVIFSLTYYLSERAGLFGVAPFSTLEVLYSIPILSASVFYLIITLITAIKHVRTMKTTGWMLMASGILLIAGLWVSYLTRFSGEVVLTEGQTFFSGHNDYIPETFYRGRFSKVPDIGMELEKITPSLSDDKSNIQGLKGTFKLISKEGADSRDVSITDRLPTEIARTLFMIGDFGHSVRYALKSQEGRVLDSSFIYMKLFPPGSEDSFRLLSPLTYYVRYFPDGDEKSEEPRIGLRIVRNKDIVFNGRVNLTENVPVENSRISFEEVRMWTRLSIVHDWGMIFAFCGMILGLLTVVMRAIKA